MSQKKPELEERKHQWVADAIVFQETISRLLGYTEHHEVPEGRLEEKMKYYFKLIGNDSDPGKTWKAVTQRIRDETEASFSSRLQRCYYLKPIFISVIDLDFEKSGNCLVFRILKEKTGCCFYVDEARTYETWTDYLENNILPKLHLIYPYGGDYKARTEIVLAESVACSPVKLARKITKIFATTTALTSTVALAAVPFCPILAPAALGLYITAASSGIVMGVDGVVNLVDLAKHNESLNVTNSRALDAYVDIGSACGGLIRGGAATAASLLKSEAETLTKILRVIKIAGSTVQNVSLLVKCLNHEFGELSLDDLKAFCFSFLNTDLETAVGWAKPMIQLFLAGVAIYRGDPYTVFRTLRSAKDVAILVFSYVLPEILSYFGPQIKEMATYFGNLFCNQFRHRLPEIIDVKTFDRMGDDLLALIGKINTFFQIADPLDVKFNGVQFFLTFSISSIRIAWKALREHAECTKKRHSLTQPQLVKLWFQFMDLIKVRSPQHLINGTNYFLIQLEKCSPESTRLLSSHLVTPCYPPKTYPLSKWADRFTFENDPETQFNVDKPEFTMEGIAVHIFYSPNLSNELTKELKQDYRNKVECILRKKVTKENSKFDKNGNGRNALLNLSPCHEVRNVVFNRTVLKNGNAMVFVTTLKNGAGDRSAWDREMARRLYS
nr:PREDICTED: uncharacterized protein LOC109034705 [Bemisia tabaci]